MYNHRVDTQNTSLRFYVFRLSEILHQLVSFSVFMHKAEWELDPPALERFSEAIFSNNPLAIGLFPEYHVSRSANLVFARKCLRRAVEVYMPSE
jgi:hypothetical protein